MLVFQISIGALSLDRDGDTVPQSLVNEFILINATGGLPPTAEYLHQRSSRLLSHKRHVGT